MSGVGAFGRDTKMVSGGFLCSRTGKSIEFGVASSRAQGHAADRALHCVVRVRIKVLTVDGGDRLRGTTGRGAAGIDAAATYAVAVFVAILARITGRDLWDAVATGDSAPESPSSSQASV